MTARSIHLTRLREAAYACARDLARYAASALAFVGVGALACVACCALPFALAAIGVSGASALAGVLEPYVAVGGGLLGLAGLAALRARSRRGPSCSTSCATDGACGCRSPGFACTIADDEIPSRVRDYRAAFAAFDRSERVGPRELVLRFRDEASTFEQVSALAALERGCCAFLDLDVERREGQVTWTIRGPAGAEPAIDALERLPSLVAAGMTERGARRMVSDLNRAMRA